MFLEHFGLREQPFGVTPDPRFLYLSHAHREALASLYYGIESGRGFLALIATPGAGKSTLLYYLLERLQNVAHTAFLFQTQCSPREFMRSLMADLQVEGPSDDLAGMQSRLNEFLIEESRRGRRFVLVVDEAQGLSKSVLETVRMLSNFETPKAKLMQIVFAGQPELAHKLASPELVQLRQRISIFARLKPLTLEETQKYIEHRLRIAGHPGPQLFDRHALSGIHQHSLGIPRNINNLCFHALTLAFAKSQKAVNASIVQEMLSDLDLACICSDDAALIAGRPALMDRSLESVPTGGTLSASSTGLGGLGETQKPADAETKPSITWPNLFDAFRRAQGWLHAFKSKRRPSKINYAFVLRRTAACAWLLTCVLLGVQVGRETSRPKWEPSGSSTAFVQSIATAKPDPVLTPEKLSATKAHNQVHSGVAKERHRARHDRVGG